MSFELKLGILTLGQHFSLTLPSPSLSLSLPSPVSRCGVCSRVVVFSSHWFLFAFRVVTLSLLTGFHLPLCVL